MTKYIIRVLQCIICNDVHKIMIAIIKSSTQKRSIIFAAANTLKVLWPLHVHPLLSHQETKKKLRARQDWDWFWWIDHWLFFPYPSLAPPFFLPLLFTAEKWQAVYTILEAFGNSSTSMNSNASRFSHVVSLDFDQAGQVASASIQVTHTHTHRYRYTDKGWFEAVIFERVDVVVSPCSDNALGETEGEQAPWGRVHLQCLLLHVGRCRQHLKVTSASSTK